MLKLLRKSTRKERFPLGLARSGKLMREFEEVAFEKERSGHKKRFAHCMKTISRPEKCIRVQQTKINTLIKSNEELKELRSLGS
jgi:hypothetical protein